LSGGRDPAAIGDRQCVRGCGLWLSDVDKAVSDCEGANCWTDTDSYASSGIVCNGPSKADHLITANQNGSWIRGERIYLGSRAGGDCYGNSLFDIAGSVGAEG
jgi:hypothetical protein